MAPLDKPPRDSVKRSVEDARKRMDKDGRVLKVLFLDEKGDSVGEWASSQLPENPFANQMGDGLQEPPFRLEQLVYLAEMHPVHSSALEQKTVDICGKGWDWRPRDPDNADEAYRDELNAWFESLADDDTDMRELLYQVTLDVQTLAWGLTEVVRDPSGIVQRLYHVPGHTCRANKDGFRLAQIRDRRKVWFRRWGAPLKNNKPVAVDAETGNVYNTRTPNDPANDLLVVRKPSRRSDWYGVPGYISAIGWITLALAARDDNLYFFSNRREPRWAIILTNLADDPNLEDDLRRSFQVDLKQPYRNILIPITGPGNIDFQKLTDNKQEGSFDKLSERADKAIMVGHRVPAERLANAELGPLGGNAVPESSRIYKEAVISPEQLLLNSRINRFLEVEYPKALGIELEKREQLPWVFELADLDLGTDREELEQAVLAFEGNLVSLREARARINLEPLRVPKKEEEEEPEPPAPPAPEPNAGDGADDDERDDDTTKEREEKPAELVESEHNDKLFFELKGGGDGSKLVQPMSLMDQDRTRALDALGKDVRQLWTAAQETHSRLADLADREDERKSFRPSE